MCPLLMPEPISLHLMIPPRRSASPLENQRATHERFSQRIDAGAGTQGEVRAKYTMPSRVHVGMFWRT